MGLMKLWLLRKRHTRATARRRPLKMKSPRPRNEEIQGSRKTKKRRKTNINEGERQADEESSASLKPNNGSGKMYEGIHTTAPPVDVEAENGGFEDVSSSLRLLRSLHSKELTLDRKIDLAYRFVDSLKEEQQILNYSFHWEKSWMGMPQLVSRLNDWIQSILISSTKQNTASQTSAYRDACLDVRCWVIFKWCLQSKYMERASFSSNLMRSVNFVLTAALAYPGNSRGSDSGCPPVADDLIKHEQDLIISGDFMKELTEVIGVLFFLHGRNFRPTLDLWASSALAAVKLGERVFLRENVDDYRLVLSKLTCQLLEEFAKYLGSHPNPRNTFPVIVEKLLEPLLSFLVVLGGAPSQREFSRNDILYSWRIRLVRIVEDIFAFGLFHSVHIDGYLNICKMDDYVESERDVKVKKKAKLGTLRKHEKEDSNAAFVSYHKSLFQKLECIRKEGKTTGLHGIGRLLSILICKKKNQSAGASQFIDTEKTQTSGISGESPEAMNISNKHQVMSHYIEDSKTSKGFTEGSIIFESKRTANEREVNPGKQDHAVAKPLINLFVEFMEPLQKDLEDCEGYIRLQDSEKFQHLSRSQSTLVAMNSLLAVVKDENIYIPTEDTPGQAHFNYLKRIYKSMFKLGALISSLCLEMVDGTDIVGTDAYEKSFRIKQHMHDLGSEKLCTMVMLDIVLALIYLLEIEYRVGEDELLSLWLLLFSFLALNLSWNKEQEKSSMLTSQIVFLGCRIISIYGELRQIDRPLFRLFESIRFFIFGSHKRAMEKEQSMFLSSRDSLASTDRVQAVVSLVSSQQFLNGVATVVSAVPEGQVAQCIKLLKVDVMDTLEWMKKPWMKGDMEESQLLEFQNPTNQDWTVQAEVAGKALSELYTLVLDKSCVTLNNSIPVGNSVKEVVNCVSICLGNFVKKSSKHVENFWQCIFSVVIGKKTFEKKDEDMKMQAKMLLWGSWFLVFILRLYLSSRSLYRQCISLMPPNPAKKSSLAIGDLLTAYSGNDWIQGGGNLTLGGYFLWIDKPSASVLDVLTAISDSIDKCGIEKVPVLLYVLQNIALQRLAELNRHIKGLEFLLDKNVRFSHAITVRNDLPTQLKEQKRLEELINVSRQEASALTEFILKYAFSLVADKVASKSCLVNVPGNNTVCKWNSVVGTLDKLSLVVAIWQLVCHNVDVWSYHASKKSRKKFVSKLLGGFLSLQRRDTSDVNFRFTGEKRSNDQKLVTVEKISSELLRNVVLYEQGFFCRYSATKICQKIRKSLLLKLNHLSFLGISSTDEVFGNLQDWPKFMKILEELRAVKYYKHGLTMMQVPEVHMEENQDITSCEGLFGDWINLLNLICWFPRGYGGVKSLSKYAYHILIIERFLVITLHRALKTSHYDPWAILQCSGMRDRTELLDLLLACRKALKSITFLYSDDEFEDRLLSLVQILFESSSSCMWLLRSVDIIAQWFSQLDLLQPSLDDPKGNLKLWKHCIFSTLDHTSGMLMIVCEGLFNLAAKPLISNVHCTSEGNNLSGIIQNSVRDHISESKIHMDFHTPLIVLAEALSSQARDTLVYLKHTKFDADLGLQESVNPLKSNSNVMGHSSQVSETDKNYSGSLIGLISLIGGIRSILWGLASALDNLDEKCRKDKTGSLKWQNDLLKNWEQYVEDFKHFVNQCIRKFLIVDTDDEGVVTKRDDVVNQHDSSTDSGQYIDAELAEYNIKEDMETIYVQEQNNEMEEEKDEAETNNLYDNMEEADDECNGVIENDGLLDLHPSEELVDHAHVFETPDLNKTFLDKLLKGEKPAEATLLGELFMALAGLVKLKHLSSSPKVLFPTRNIKTMSLAFMNSYIGAADWIILEAAKTIRSSRSLSLGWLGGIVKYLESISSFIPYMTPIFPPMAYAKLINLHLQAIAAVCFPMPAETKRSILYEDQYENDNHCSSVNTLDNNSSCFKVDGDSLNDLKGALRRSFSMLLRKPLQVHLSLALQSIERTLAGVWIGNHISSELRSGSHNGGKVGRMVAAGVECLDLALDSISGPKRMKLLAKHCSTFVGSLLNIIVHLQGPHIFFVSRSDQCQDGNYVDKALVIQACVEVLSKVASRHTIFPLSASHVGQSLAFPAVLFQHLCQFKSTQCVTPCASLQIQAIGFKKGTLLPKGTYAVVKKVSVELYISCCRLLCALLRHRNRESGHCMALLGDSVRVFLFCLEVRDRDMNAQCWTIEEGVTCASWLRRVYEEMGQHKETLGRYCSHILSDYICVVCGFGPENSGLHREIDEALRPGAYALIDACSLEDLQQMHAVLGEGPRRTALQTLKNDYERHFKYTGKI